MGTGILNIPHIQTLNLVANLDAAHALDAFSCVSDKRKGSSPAGFGVVDRVFVCYQIQVICYLLKPAVSASDAGGAVCVVLGEDQFHIGLSGLPDAGAVGEYFHTLCDRGVAGGDKAACPGHFHNTDAACSDLIDSL